LVPQTSGPPIAAAQSVVVVQSRQPEPAGSAVQVNTWAPPHAVAPAAGQVAPAIIAAGGHWHDAIPGAPWQVLTPWQRVAPDEWKQPAADMQVATVRGSMQ
jgi:hypothetical protein